MLLQKRLPKKILKNVLKIWKKKEKKFPFQKKKKKVLKKKKQTIYSYALGCFTKYVINVFFMIVYFYNS
jgi:hypothetical protein